MFAAKWFLTGFQVLLYALCFKFAILYTNSYIQIQSEPTFVVWSLFTRICFVLGRRCLVWESATGVNRNFDISRKCCVHGLWRQPTSPQSCEAGPNVQLLDACISVLQVYLPFSLFILYIQCCLLVHGLCGLLVPWINTSPGVDSDAGTSRASCSGKHGH